MKITELLESDISKDDIVVLSGIRESIDHLNAYKLGELTSIDPSFAEVMGTTVEYEELTRQQKIDIEIAALDRAFAISKPCKKPLYRGIRSFDDVEGGLNRYLSASENITIAKSYGTKLIEILPGTVTLDFDVLIGKRDGVRHHLFKPKQKFSIVSQTDKKVVVKGI